jgi:hypothetical protein
MYNFYPKINLNVDNLNTIRLVDITVSAKIKRFLREYSAISIRPYTISNGERPDTVSKRLYDTPYYDYIILMVNNIENIYDQWPKNPEIFNEYLVKKYGSLEYARNTIGYFYSPEGYTISQEFWESITNQNKYRETYLQYETRLNDDKAKIRVIDFAYIVKFESDLQELLSNR